MSEINGEINDGKQAAEQGKETFTSLEGTHVVEKVASVNTSVNDAANLENVRDSLDTIAHPPPPTEIQITRDDSSPMVPKDTPSLVKKISTEIGDRASSLVYNLLRGKTPPIIKNRVPVFRTVNEDYAGIANQKGESEWTIGTMGKKHANKMLREQTYDPSDPAKEYLKDRPKVVIIKSSVGKLAEVGTVKVRPYGQWGQSEKIILDHTHQEPVAFTVVGSNKDT